MLTASCLCERFIYSVDGPIAGLMYCHCTMCRKRTGAAFWTGALIAAKDLSWIRREGEYRIFKSSDWATSPSCRDCGARVPHDPPDRTDARWIPAGSLEGDVHGMLSILPAWETHVFVGNKAPWHTINDDVHQWERAPNDFVGVERPVRPHVQGVVQGSCLCGEVTYEFDEGPENVDAFFHCHCLNCRRASQTMYVTYLVAECDAFRWISGRDVVSDYEVPGGTHTVSFCSKCGSASPVMTRANDHMMMRIPAGSLDDDPGVRPTEHKRFDSSGWFKIDRASAP